MGCARRSCPRARGLPRWPSRCTTPTAPVDCACTCAIDERSAAFLALGLAKASGRPVPVVTTSGTATANLHPAVLEASLSGVPLLLLTADRPPELRGSGANQTVDQLALYGGAVRLFVELGAPEQRVGQNAYWRATTCRVLAAARGDLGSAPGPVHVNVALRDPLVPADGDWVEDLEGRTDGAPWTTRSPVARPAPADDLPERTVVVIGDGGDTAGALGLAESRGFPVVAEPSSGAHGPQVVAAAEVVLATAGWLDEHRPDRVLVVGRPTLSRAVGRLLATTPTDVVAAHLPWPDPSSTAARVLTGVPRSSNGDDGDLTWAASWLDAGQRAAAAVSEVLDGSGLTEPVVAAEVVRAADRLLVVGSSKPVRDLLLAPGKPGLQVLANRGVAGIDGMVSTAVGAALAHGGRTLALLGDLTFLHDSNGLLIGPDEPRPDLTLVVVNNDGGAIFGLLEQGDPSYAEAFERVFGTPHGADLGALCATTGTPHVRVETVDDLRAALGGAGLRVVEVRTDRREAVALDGRVRAAVAQALA